MATRSTAWLLIPMTALALLGGCADRGRFPSLAPRAAERLSTQEPVRTAPFVAADPDLQERVAALVGQARRGQDAFQTALPAARSSAGRAGAAASESWIEAQQALSRLEAARAMTVTALAELDRLMATRAAVPTNADQFVELRTATETVASLTETQQVEIDRLRRLLRPA